MTTLYHKNLQQYPCQDIMNCFLSSDRKTLFSISGKALAEHELRSRGRSLSLYHKMDFWGLYFIQVFLVPG